MTTREEWLNAAVAELRKWFADVDVKIPDAVRVTCGWSKRAGNGIGWCWKREASADKTNEILISPEKSDRIEVLATLVHELIHASDDGESKHSGYFRQSANTIGLEGKMTATVPSQKLSERLGILADKLGSYPHAAINPMASTITKQPTRMIKLSCPDDGYTVRTTKKWIEQGFPKCPCGNEMELAS